MLEESNPMLPKKAFPWKLTIFPALEVFFFISAIFESNLFLSLLFMLVASVLLSFSIHIYFHECVHARKNYPIAVNIIHSLLLGLPFDGYRVHHFNHHTHENGLKDFSTTWFMQDGKRVGYSACSYYFGWIRQLNAAMREPEPFDQSLGDVATIKARIPVQKVAILFFFIILAFAGFKYFILYFLLIYFGWAFSALHNYGQHPPIEKEPICTYADQRYNVFFFNNGLHWEHHDKPWLSWDELELDKNSNRINHAHLIEPCFQGKKQ